MSMDEYTEYCMRQTIKAKANIQKSQDQKSTETPENPISKMFKNARGNIEQGPVTPTPEPTTPIGKMFHKARKGEI